ncbi:MAG: TraR/DksA family transcriptional regulator [Nitrospirota bacterium]
MSRSNYKKIKEMLLSKKKSLLSKNNYYTEVSERHGDTLDSATSETQNMIDDAFDRKTLLTIRDIDTALRKIDDGSYGLCEECGEEIPPKRLEVFPTATLCIRCKEEMERYQKTISKGGRDWE